MKSIGIRLLNNKVITKLLAHRARSCNYFTHQSQVCLYQQQTYKYTNYTYADLGRKQVRNKIKRQFYSVAMSVRNCLILNKCFFLHNVSCGTISWLRRLSNLITTKHLNSILFNYNLISIFNLSHMSDTNAQFINVNINC